MHAKHCQSLTATPNFNKKYGLGTRLHISLTHKLHSFHLQLIRSFQIEQQSKLIIQKKKNYLSTGYLIGGYT